MIKQKQLYKHDPENGVFGDCFRTAIACLLDLKPEQVPHPYQDGEVATLTALEMMDKWLAETHDLKLVEIPFEQPLPQVQLWARQSLGPLHYLLIGKSSNGTGHTVVCQHGEIVCDPALDNSGIVGRMDNCYWIGLLVDIV